MVCLFCLRETNDGISINGESQEAKNARKTIAKYFWFDEDQIDSPQKYVCSDCWQKVEAFHEFYLMVEAIHHRSNDFDEKIAHSPLFVTEFVCDVDDTKDTINIEHNTLEVSIPEYSENSIFLDESDGKLMATQNPSEFDATNLTIDQRDSLINKKPKSTSINFDKEKSTKASKAKHSKKVAETAQNIQEIQCFMCSKSFATFRCLRNHFHLHDPAESRTFECDYCGKKFSRRRTLQQHVAYHVRYREKKSNPCIDEKRAKICPMCGSKHRTFKCLKSHLMNDHDNKKIETPNTHMCEVCGRGFSNRHKLAAHALTHLDRKLTEVQCDICGKWVKNQNTLREHKYTHIECPQKCPHCGKIKKNGRTLQQHISGAHPLRRHQCTFCEKSFNKPKLLKEHVATHTGVPLYDCLYCPQKFKSNANMYAHLKKQHTELWSLHRAKKYKT